MLFEGSAADLGRMRKPNTQMMCRGSLPNVGIHSPRVWQVVIYVVISSPRPERLRCHLCPNRSLRVASYSLDDNGTARFELLHLPITKKSKCKECGRLNLSCWWTKPSWWANGEDVRESMRKNISTRRKARSFGTPSGGLAERDPNTAAGGSMPVSKPNDFHRCCELIAAGDVADCLLKTSVDNFPPLLVPNPGSRNHNSEGETIRAPQNNKWRILSRLPTMSALHLKEVSRSQAPSFKAIIPQYWIVTIAGLCEAAEQGPVNEGLLQAILGITIRHSAMGPQDDRIPDISCYEHFKATVQILRTRRSQQRTWWNVLQ